MRLTLVGTRNQFQAPNMGVDLYKDQKDEWRWRIVATNGRIVACSGEGYKNSLDAIAGVIATKNILSADTLKITQLPEGSVV